MKNPFPPPKGAQLCESMSSIKSAISRELSKTFCQHSTNVLCVLCNRLQAKPMKVTLTVVTLHHLNIGNIVFDGERYGDRIGNELKLLLKLFFKPNLHKIRKR